MGVAAALEKQQPDSLRLTLLLARAGSPVVSTARLSSRILTALSPQTKWGQLLLRQTEDVLPRPLQGSRSRKAFTKNFKVSKVGCDSVAVG